MTTQITIGTELTQGAQVSVGGSRVGELVLARGGSWIFFGETTPRIFTRTREEMVRRLEVQFG